MTSTKQILANRRNGQLSRGPVTEEGKVISCMNAVQHGLLAKQAVIEGDDLEDFVDANNFIHNYSPLQVQS